MSNRKGRFHKQIPTPRDQVISSPPKGILELDRYSEASIEKWNVISADLDELNDVLHFNLEPERRRRRTDLIDSLKQIEAQSFQFENWVRIVDYQWSLKPLSAAGSLTYVGGRFNAGIELDTGTLDAWPALYIAQDHSTAYREKFQIQERQNVGGLTAEELSLNAGQSHSTVVLNGALSKVFPMTPDNLAPLSRVLAQIQMPSRAAQLKRTLGIAPNDLTMIRTGRQLFDLTTTFNWRVLPVQFGLPSQSHIIAELIRAAGFEAIEFPSSKGGGRCLAIFVDQLQNGSHVSLSSPAPPGVIGILNESTADELAGWDTLGIRRR